MADNILILGNGFDLAMGRKTSYEDFFFFIDYFYILLKLSDENPNRVTIDNSFLTDSEKIAESRLKRCLEEVQQNEKEEIKEYFQRLSLEDLIILFQNPIIEAFERSGVYEDKDFTTEFVNYLKPFLQSWKIEYDSKIIKVIEGSLENRRLPINVLEIQNSFQEEMSFEYFCRATSNNLFIEFIRKHKKNLGNNWSNLELVIADLVEALSDIKENLQNFYSEILAKNSSNYLDIRYLWFNNEIFRHKKNYEAYQFLSEKLKEGFNESSEQSDIKLINGLNESLISDLDILTNLLELYLCYLHKTDFEKRKISKKETVIDAISNLKESNVINFNYTDTALKIFGIPLMNTHFIHGKIKLNRRQNNINTLVFGIEDKEDRIESINNDLIPFQKFYQRTVKETGNDYKNFFAPTMINRAVDDVYTVGKRYPKNIIIFGHSVDPLDKEIFRSCFELAELKKYQYQFIFCYYDQFAKQSIVKNLAIILGKSRLIELTGKNKIKFINSKDVERMKMELY